MNGRLDAIEGKLLRIIRRFKVCSRTRRETLRYFGRRKVQANELKIPKW